MNKRPMAVLVYLLISVTLAACASAPVVIVPDTMPGDQIKNEYLVGKWCTNREETAISNQAAGFSGLLNVNPVFWRFQAEGDWETSTSGFMYQPYGSWKIIGLDELQLSRKSMEPKPYRVYFKNNGEGPDLYLTDAKGQFTVLSHCK